MTDRKAYMKEYMRKNRANKAVNKPVKSVNKKAVSPPKSVSTIWQDVDQSIFETHGRGVPVGGFVLISLGAVPEESPECGVVTESTWRARLDQTCKHDLMGWSCKSCLNG